MTVMDDEKRFQRHLAKAKEWTLQTLKAKTATEFQRMVRAETAVLSSQRVVIDGEVTTVRTGPGKCACVTCGDVLPWTGSNCMDSGHFIAGRRNSVIFEAVGCHPQCSYCNRSGGMPAEYRLFMLEVYGQEVIDELERLNNQVSRKFDRDELVRMRIEFMDRTKRAIERMGIPMQGNLISAELVQLEEQIEPHLAAIRQNWEAVAPLLRQVKDQRLYMETHSTFEQYCRDRWDIGKTRAYELVADASGFGMLNGATSVRQSERTPPSLTDGSDLQDLEDEYVEKHGADRDTAKAKAKAAVEQMEADDVEYEDVEDDDEPVEGFVGYNDEDDDLPTETPRMFAKELRALWEEASDEQRISMQLVLREISEQAAGCVCCGAEV